MRQDIIIEACARAGHEAVRAFFTAASYSDCPQPWGEINGYVRTLVEHDTVLVLQGMRPTDRDRVDPVTGDLFAATVRAVATACGFDFKTGVAVAGG